MVRVLSAQEWADETNRPIEEIEAMINEAELGLITRNDLDPSTLVEHNITPETREKMRRLVERARESGPDL